MKPQHFHLGAAVLLGISSVGALFFVHGVLAGFLALGSFMALAHWKAAKLGIMD